jgi:fucose 4-O-acetylase-like acetyltransferase
VNSGTLFHREFQMQTLWIITKILVAEQHTMQVSVRIDAALPFFVTKLNIKTLPTLLVFKDGKTMHRLINEGYCLAIPTTRHLRAVLQAWLAETGAMTMLAR